MQEIDKIDLTDESKTLKQEAKEVGMSEPVLKNVLDNILHEAEEKHQREKLKNFRKNVDIPISSDELVFKLERIIRRGGAKLSQLFLVFNHKDEGDFQFTLPDKLVKTLKDNLQAIGMSELIDTYKIRVYYAYWIPANLIQDSRVYNYPNVSKPSTRFKTEIAGKPGIIQ